MNQDSVAASTTSRVPRGEDLLLTMEEAAQRLGIGRTVMYRLVSTGSVESVKLGRLRRVPRECLDEFVASLRGQGTRITSSAG